MKKKKNEITIKIDLNDIAQRTAFNAYVFYLKAMKDLIKADCIVKKKKEEP